MTGIMLRLGSLRRSGTGRSDQGSMPMALLITLVAMALSATIMPLVINQVTSTRTVSSRTQALQAAQAGIDVALGQLRSAVGTAGAGDLESLPPCVMTGPADAGWGYRVTIVYYSLAADDAAEPEPQGCPPTDVPVSAILTSTGGPAAGTLAAGSAGTRTIEATYTFKTTNENISGGAIQLADPPPIRFAWTRGPTPHRRPGRVVKVQRCKAGGSSDQRFAYTSNLNIKLVGSETRERTGRHVPRCSLPAYGRRRSEIPALSGAQRAPAVESQRQLELQQHAGERSQARRLLSGSTGRGSRTAEQHHRAGQLRWRCESANLPAAARGRRRHGVGGRPVNW